MNFLSNATAGWSLAMSSIKILNKNKRLIIFPILSGLVLIALLSGFATIVLSGTNPKKGDEALSSITVYFILFLFYLASYFVIVFFNMALVYCTNQYFSGKKVSVGKGFHFSLRKVHVILLWSLFSATIGLGLKIIKDNGGSIGKVLTGVAEFAWNIATFLVVPILAYENVGPLEALKRSAGLMSKKWGKGVTASFTFVFIYLLSIIMFAIIAGATEKYISDNASIAILVGGILLTFVVGSTLQNIFVSALYCNLQGNEHTNFSQNVIDEAFE